MQPLFRIERRKSGRGQGLLGYEWVEVLAIEPWALGYPDREFGDWCYRRVSCQYVCLTPAGLMRIGSEDFWAAMEEYDEYDEMTAQSNNPLIVTTSDHSVVQIGGVVYGGIRTGGDEYNAETVGAQGPKSRGKISFAPADMPFAQLEAELGQLLVAAEQESDGPGKDFVLKALRESRAGAVERDREKILTGLRRAGTSALRLARELELELTGAVISHSMVM